MPRTTHQTKKDKAEYDKQRKALERKERRFTKPLKIFFQRKYSILYEEFVKFFNDMESKHPGKKDLTKTDTFKNFLTIYPAQTKTLSSPVETYSTQIEVLETSVDPAQVKTSSPVETYSTQIEVLETSVDPAQVKTFSPVEISLVSDIIDELFGPGGLDEYVNHMENIDEGIEINHLDELRLDLEPFDFELETVDF